GSITDCYATGPVTGDDRVGGLVGRNEYGIITNCYATGSVSGHDYVGGLVGRDNYGNITNCYAAGSVTGNTSVGGLVGGNYEPKSTSNCYTTGLIQGVSEVGGLIGRSGRDSISNCYTIGSVYGDNYVGGLVGRSGCDNISNSYTTGLVEGVSSVGGLVGEVQWTTITDCHATGSVTGSGDYVGGLLGFLPKTPRHPSFPQMEISNCYATGSVIGRNYVGGLVAYGIGTLTNCYAIGSVSGYEDVGGLMGYNYQCVITNCYATGSVKGTHTTGSMVGTNREGTITNCCAAGPVSGNQYTGGIAGLNWFYGSISNCCSIGSVTGSGDYVGGLAGECSGSFTNCYSTSPISGAGDYVGGLVGLSFHGIITDCYAAGLINAVGNYVGGLVGENDSGSVTRVYFLDPNDGGGPDNGYGEPLTDLQMRQQVSFIDWDFVGAGDGDEDIWSICEGVGYPRLYWEKCPMAAGPELGSFEIIEKTRIGRSVFRYVLGVAIANNSNVALTDVRLSLVNSSPQVTAVIDGEIALDSVGAWALIDTSAVGEYFIIDVDRTAPIEVEEMSLRLRCNSAGGDCCIMLLPVPIDARPVVLNMAKLAEMWLWAGPSGAIAEDVVPDGRVNFADFAMLYDRLPGEE
ncbi:MAG: hypothetical protein JW720_16230, partial [Sedimentisphaerales bacterium]|nr:hypothetical protein [Sedimentisphaerales bacterium]